MSTDVAGTMITEMVAAGAVDLEAGERTAESLALLLAKAAERVRSDPESHLEHCAVRWAAGTLRARLDDRMQLRSAAARDEAEGS